MTYPGLIMTGDLPALVGVSIVTYDLPGSDYDGWPARVSWTLDSCTHPKKWRGRGVPPSRGVFLVSRNGVVEESPPCCWGSLGLPDLHWSSQRFEGKGLVAYREGISTPSTPYLRQAALTTLMWYWMLRRVVFIRMKNVPICERNRSPLNNSVNFIDYF